MPEFYYQIKAKQEDSSDSYFGKWVWPPVFSGKVEAADKKEARSMIDKEYGHTFPMRVLEKDRASADFLLKLDQMRERDGRHELFEDRECKNCGNTFRIIDNYNDDNQPYKGREFCSWDCKEEHVEEHSSNSILRESKHPPVIYAIQNKKTGMSYVGQTIRAFTLRWWQHFSHGSETKFHQAIEKSCLTDWIFSIVEIVHEKDKPEDMDMNDYLHVREQHWIDEYDTIENGYNSVISKKMKPDEPVKDDRQGELL